MWCTMLSAQSRTAVLASFSFLLLWQWQGNGRRAQYALGKGVDRGAESLPARCWEETPAAFAARLRAACAHVNANYNVEGLCREFPSRIQQLIDHKGGRLKQ